MATNINQKTDALHNANRTRKLRAEFKAEVKSADSQAFACEMVATLVWLPPRWASAWRVSEVLDLIPRLGPMRIENMMMRAGIMDNNRTLYELTTRQSSVLADLIRDVAG